MKKTPSVFKRDYEGTRLVYNEVVEGCEWVLNGEGVPTVKIDGTACLVQDGVLYKRYDAKQGKVPPPGFIPAQEHDPVTGHYPGWLIANDPAADWRHIEAWDASGGATLPNGTYELIGPAIQSSKLNPYPNLKTHRLVKHGLELIDADTLELTYEGIKRWLDTHAVEGIVWHHPDGRMAKVKRKDFGFAWPCLANVDTGTDTDR